MKIGIISDTHGVLTDKVKDNLKGCDYIIHGGDVGNESIITELNNIARTFCVRGNNDKDKWTEDLPLCLNVKLQDVGIFVVHDKNDIPKDLKDVKLVVYGHSHKYEEMLEDGVLFINPGGCGKRRFKLPLTMAVLDVDNTGIDILKIEL